ncbi:MAG: TolC family protein [Baekduia sp.]
MLELELRLAADARHHRLRHATRPCRSWSRWTTPTASTAWAARSTSSIDHACSDNHFEDWSVGLTARDPARQREPRGRASGGRSSRRLQRLGHPRRPRAVHPPARCSTPSTPSTPAWQRILAARQSVILNTRTLQAEQRQFDVGNSTSTDVLDAAARLADAQLAEIRALTDYQIAQVDLAFATGTLLGAGKVDWTPAPTPSQGLDARLPEWLDWIKRVPGPGDPEPANAPAPPRAARHGDPRCDATPADPAQPAPPSNQ